MKVVINACHGGFGLSDAAFEKLLDRKGIAWEKQEGKFGGIDYFHAGHVGSNDHYLFDSMVVKNRADPDLIAIFEEMGHLANCNYSRLKIVEVPDDVEWEVDEYDGKEWVAEKHRTWE